MTSTLTSRRISEACMADAISQVKAAVDEYNVMPMPHESFSRFVAVTNNAPLDDGRVCDVALSRFRSYDGFKVGDKPEIVHFIDFYPELPGEFIVLQRGSGYHSGYADYYNMLYRCPEFLKIVGEKCFRDGKILDEYLPYGAVLKVDQFCHMPLHTQLLEQASRALSVQRLAEEKGYRAKYHALPITDRLETKSQLIDNLLTTGRAERLFRTWCYYSTDGGEAGPNNVSMLKEYMIKQGVFKPFSRIYRGRGNWELVVRD